MTEINQRVVPQDIEAEVCVLGSMILDPRCVQPVTEILQTGHFFRPAHQVIFDAVVAIAAETDAVDLVLLRQRLQSAGKLESVGGSKYLVSLIEGMIPVNATHYAKMVFAASQKRELIRVGNTLIQQGYGTATAQDMIAEAELGIYKVSNIPASTASNSFVIDQVVSNASSGKHGLKLGIAAFDHATAGLMPGSYTIIGGRPKAGKSFLVQNMAVTLCEQGEYVHVATMEMSKAEVFQRMMCILSGVWLLDVRHGRAGQTESARLRDAGERMKQWNIEVDQRSSTVASIATGIRASARKWGRKPSVVIIDHFQLMTGPGRSRYDQFSEISRSIKLLAMEMEVPFVVLSQFKRPADTREELKPPSRYSLKETGQIEQDLDHALLMFDATNESTPGGQRKVWGCLAFNRHGPEVWWPSHTTAGMSWTVDSASGLFALDETY